jgi:hypothetical protein
VSIVIELEILCVIGGVNCSELIEPLCLVVVYCVYLVKAILEFEMEVAEEAGMKSKSFRRTVYHAGRVGGNVVIVGRRANHRRGRRSDASICAN